MKKTLAVLVAALLLITVFPYQQASAVTYYPIGTALYLDAAWTGNANGLYTIYCQSFSYRLPYMYGGGLYVKYDNSGGSGYQCFWYDPINSTFRPLAIGTNYCPMAYIEDGNFSGNITLSSNFGNCVCYSVQKDFTDNLPSDYKPVDPSWWQIMWDTMNDYFTGDPFEWIKTLINGVFADDNEDTITEAVPIESPTIAPTPTSIPYTTVVIPKTDPITGDIYYETNYYYTNPSGTPIITTSPPTNTPSQNNPSNGTDYSPVDPMSIPQLPWLTNTTIGDEDLDGMTSISKGIDSIDEIGSDYISGMNAVQDSTGTLPVSWLLLIGIAAAIPLVAGIISRFLS